MSSKKMTASSANQKNLFSFFSKVNKSETATVTKTATPGTKSAKNGRTASNVEDESNKATLEVSTPSTVATSNDSDEDWDTSSPEEKKQDVEDSVKKSKDVKSRNNASSLTGIKRRVIQEDSEEEFEFDDVIKDEEVEQIQSPPKKSKIGTSTKVSEKKHKVVKKSTVATSAAGKAKDSTTKSSVKKNKASKTPTTSKQAIRTETKAVSVETTSKLLPAAHEPAKEPPTKKIKPSKEPAKKAANDWGFLNGTFAKKKTPKNASDRNSGGGFKAYTAGDDLPVISHPQEVRSN